MLFIQQFRDMFRHGVFPDALGLVEVLKIAEITMGMLTENFFQKGTMFPVREIDVSCNLIPFLWAQVIESGSGDLFDDFPGNIDGKEISIVFPCGEDEGSIETIGKSPVSAPVRLFEKLCFLDFSLEIALYGLLLWHLEEFHGNVGPWFAYHQGLEDLHLYQMIFGTGMHLSNEDKALLFEAGNKFFKGNYFPFRQRNDLAGEEVTVDPFHRRNRHTYRSGPGTSGYDEHEQGENKKKGGSFV